MHRTRPLCDYPPGTLVAIRSAVTTLLRYQDILPTDLYVKLNLLRDDLTEAGSSSALPSRAFTPHPAQARQQPNQRM